MKAKSTNCRYCPWCGSKLKLMIYIQPYSKPLFYCGKCDVAFTVSPYKHVDLDSKTVKTKNRTYRIKRITQQP